MALVVKVNGAVVASTKVMAKSLSINRTYDKKRSLSITLYYNALQGLFKEGQDIEIFEDTTIKFGGVIKKVQSIPMTPNQSSTALLGAIITSDGYNSIPKRRTVTSYYNNTDAGTIVSSLITNFLSQEGITAGVIETGATIDTYNAIYRDLKDILDDLADASGFTWNIDDEKELNFIAQDKTPIWSKTLDTDDGDHFRFSPVNSLDRFRNKQWVEGGYDAEGNIIRVDVSNDADIADRAAIEGGSGVYGDVYRDVTLQTEDDALVVANELLYRYGNTLMATFKSYALKTEYYEGEIIAVNYPKYGISNDLRFLVTKKNMTRDRHRWVYSYTIEKRDTANFSGKVSSDAVDFFSKIVKNASASSVPGAQSSLSGRAHDFATGVSVGTAVVSRSVEFILPDIADIMTQLTMQYTATAAVTLTLVYQDNDVTDHTFTMDLPAGEDVRTLNIPELDHAPGNVKIDIDMSASADGVLTIDDYMLRSRWERYVNNYTPPPPPKKGWFVEADLSDTWGPTIDVNLTSYDDEYFYIKSNGGTHFTRYNFKTQEFDPSYYNVSQNPWYLGTYTRNFDAGNIDGVLWGLGDLGLTWFNTTLKEADTGYLALPTNWKYTKYHIGDYLYFIDTANHCLRRFEISTKTFDLVWEGGDWSSIVAGLSVVQEFAIGLEGNRLIIKLGHVTTYGNAKLIAIDVDTEVTQEITINTPVGIEFNMSTFYYIPVTGSLDLGWIILREYDSSFVLKEYQYFIDTNTLVEIQDGYLLDWEYIQFFHRPGKGYGLKIPQGSGAKVARPVFFDAPTSTYSVGDDSEALTTPPSTSWLNGYGSYSPIVNNVMYFYREQYQQIWAYYI